MKYDFIPVINEYGHNIQILKYIADKHNVKPGQTISNEIRLEDLKELKAICELEVAMEEEFEVV